MATVLVTGSAGFIGGYVVEELLRRGHEVVGIDNLSKYGRVTKSYDDHRSYSFVEGDARDVDLMTKLLLDCDHFIAGAAMIGGISYFHTYAYDLLATNERIIATSCDAAIEAHHAGRLQKVTYLSSSMVFESATSWPSAEGQEHEIPPPISSYGFQKLAVEYFARAAQSQYGLPFTILRPFNCVGVGERRALGDVEILSGNVSLAMSHVVPDLVQKVLKGQDPLHLLGDGSQIRHYTYGGDLAEGIVTAMESPDALNEDFNLSTATSTTVLELAETIWKKIRGEDSEFHYVVDTPFEHDVARRIPETEKAARVLGFEATTSLSEMLDEVIPWISRAVDEGSIYATAPPAVSDGLVLVHRVMSLDAFIAGPHHEIDWIFEYDAPAEGADVMASTGAMLSGRHTYEVGQRSKRPESSAANEDAWSGAEFVLTHRTKSADDDASVVFLSGSVADAVATGLAAADGKNLEVLGTDVTAQCLALGLVDEIYVHVLPVLLGAGVPLFHTGAMTPVRLEPMISSSNGSVTSMRFRVDKGPAGLQA